MASLSRETDGHPAICGSTARPRGHYARGSKPDEYCMLLRVESEKPASLKQGQDWWLSGLGEAARGPLSVGSAVRGPAASLCAVRGSS